MRFILVFVFAAIMIVGCSQPDQTDHSKETSEKQLEIYTSLYPIQYAVERIGGDTVTTHSVYPPGADAHTYEPSSKEIVAIAKSDAFFYLGAGMEAFSETVADSLASQDVHLVEIGEKKDLFIKEEHHDDGEEHGQHHHGDLDPHIWLDPLRLLEVSDIVKEELISLNPQAKEAYEKNFASLQEDLTELDKQFIAVLENKKNKHILVSHAAYGYWEDRYGIEQIAVNGLSSSNEPSQKELTNIINRTKEYGLDYIFFEQNVSNRVSEIIQAEIGAKSAVIHNLEVLTEEDMDKNEDYITLMERNLDVLDKAMQ
jgi:zinc transport system substrate-binding protein